MAEWRRRERGQVIVEVLLVLPIFLILVFTIMEIGHLAFRTILLHHAAYEVARYGSLTTNARASIACSQPQPNAAGMRAVAGRILPTARMEEPVVRQTLVDPQERCPNYDVIVTLRQSVPMIFPLTGLILADRRSRGRTLSASVPMPIERPLFR